MIKLYFLGLVLLSFSMARANVLVNQQDPYPQSSMKDEQRELFFAGNQTGTLMTGRMLPKYVMLNTSKAAATNSANLITINVSTDAVIPLPTTPAAGAWVLAVNLSTLMTSDPIMLKGGVNGYAAAYIPGSVLRLQFSLDDLCAFSINPSPKGDGTGTLCSNYQTQSVSNGSFFQQIYVTFGYIDTGTVITDSSNLPNTNPIVSGAFGSATINVTDITPTAEAGIIQK